MPRVLGLLGLGVTAVAAGVGVTAVMAWVLALFMLAIVPWVFRLAVQNITFCSVSGCEFTGCMLCCMSGCMSGCMLICVWLQIRTSTDMCEYKYESLISISNFPLFVYLCVCEFV